jgi:hypothetical protein
MNQPPPPEKTDSKLPPKETRAAGGGKAPKGYKKPGKGIPAGYVPQPFKPLGGGLARTPVVLLPGLSRFQQSVTVDINPDPTEKSDTPPDPDPSEVFGRKGLTRTPPPTAAPQSSPDPEITETPSGTAGSEPTVSDKTFRVTDLISESSDESDDSTERENLDEIEDFRVGSNNFAVGSGKYQSDSDCKPPKYPVTKGPFSWARTARKREKRKT